MTGKTDAETKAERARAIDASDAAYVAGLSAGERGREAARLAADRANEAAESETHRLETYEEAWARLGITERLTSTKIVELGVVRQLVPREKP